MHTIFGRNVFDRNVFACAFAPDFGNVILGKFCSLVPSPTNLAFFFAAVLDVFKLRAKRQMRSANAAAIVTNVHDNHTVGNLAVLQLPGEAVGADQFSIDRKDAISLSLDVTGPHPAIAGLVDLLPKTFFSGARVMTVDVSDGATLDPAKTPSSVGRNWSKLTTTALAVSVFNFARGIVSGIVRLHVESPFDVPSPGVLMTPPGQLITYQYCIPLGRFSQNGVLV